MATTDTVLQPGSEDLSAFTGPAGPQGPTGPTGPTGPSASNHKLSILVSMDFSIDGYNKYEESSTTITYLVSGGTKFNPTGSLAWSTALATTNTRFTGTLSNFLPIGFITDPYSVQIAVQKWVDNNGAQPSETTALPFNVFVFNKNDNQFTWRVGNCNNAQAFGPGKRLVDIAYTWQTLEFSIDITA